MQGVLEETLRRTVRHEVDLIGSGRTDAGVHAAGHVSSFQTTSALPADRLRHAIGSRLPDDLAVLRAQDVHPDFHATRSAISKLYRYRIHNAQTRPVEDHAQRYVHHFWHGLDVDRMRAASRYFLGRRDFSAMASQGQPRLSNVRTVLRCDVERARDEVRIDVEGDGFLYNQVRNMVGTLMNVGRGQWEADQVAEILASESRINAGPTVPANGLCLRWVRYPPELLRPPGAGLSVSADEEND